MLTRFQFGFTFPELLLDQVGGRRQQFFGAGHPRQGMRQFFQNLDFRSCPLDVRICRGRRRDRPRHDVAVYGLPHVDNFRVKE